MLKLSLKKTLFLGLGIVAIFLLALSLLNIRALWLAKEDIHQFAYWSEVDMTMNEEVIQPFCELERDFKGFVIHSITGMDTSEPKNAVKQDLQKLEKGLKEFEKMVSYPPIHNSFRQLRNSNKNFLSLKTQL